MTLTEETKKKLAEDSAEEYTKNKFKGVENPDEHYVYVTKKDYGYGFKDGFDKAFSTQAERIKGLEERDKMRDVEQLKLIKEKRELEAEVENIKASDQANAKAANDLLVERDLLLRKLEKAKRQRDNLLVETFDTDDEHFYDKEVERLNKQIDEVK